MIGTITGISTTAGFFGGTFTPTNVPSDDARLELQYRTVGGGSCNFWAARWATDEGNPAAGTPFIAATLWGSGSSAGKSTSANTGGAAIYYTFPGLRPGVISGEGPQHQWLGDWVRAGYTILATIYADPGSSTVFNPVLMRRWYRWEPITGAPGVYRIAEQKTVIADFGVMGAAGFETAEVRAEGADWVGGVGLFDFETVSLEFAKNDVNSVTVQGVTLDLVPPDHPKSTQAWNVPGARVGCIDVPPIPTGARLRWALRHSSGSSTNFHPRVYSERNDLGRTIPHEVVDFGEVSSASGVLTAEGGSFGALAAGDTLRLVYSLDSGGPTTVESLTLDAVYPESED